MSEERRKKPKGMQKLKNKTYIIMEKIVSKDKTHTKQNIKNKRLSNTTPPKIIMIIWSVEQLCRFPYAELKNVK